MLSEKFECRFNSKGTVAPWVAGCVTHVLSRPEKRNDDLDVRVRLKIRKRRDALTQDGGEADPGDERGGTTGSREPPWIVRTRSASARLRGARRASNDSEPRNRGKLAKKSMMGHKKKYISKFFIRRNGENTDCSKCPSFVTTRAKMSREAPLCDFVRDDGTRPKDCLVEEGCRLSELPHGS